MLENNARREVREETGVDLDPVELRYLGSEVFRSDAGAAVLAVTFVAEVPPGVEPVVAAADELSEVGWWSLDELAADPRCVPWTLRLCRQADAVVSAPVGSGSAVSASPEDAQPRTRSRTVSGSSRSRSVTVADKEPPTSVIT